VRPHLSVSRCQRSPQHRLWAIEYHCPPCRPSYRGRFFKTPDRSDLDKVRHSELLLGQLEASLPIPRAEIPAGDESTHLHRWGYRRYREMFTSRQLLGLGLLLRRIMEVPNRPVRDALLTVFSDSIRYQNLLARYDTHALKCQDLFSVQGFPVGLIQCENTAIGIPGVGSGSFRHFVEKCCRAERYCLKPFEARGHGQSKVMVPIEGEQITSRITDRLPSQGRGQGREERKSVYLHAGSAEHVELPDDYLDGVFTALPTSTTCNMRS
jgi:hypothetical protein